MKKGLVTSELWMTTIPGLAILAHGATTSTEVAVQVACYWGIAVVSAGYGLTRALTKKNGGAA